MAAPVSKTLLLIRHAHRDTSDRDADNGLSSKGLEQVQALLGHYRMHYEAQAASSGVKVVSSSRRRCRETVEGVARIHKLKVESLSELMEQGADEPNRAFVERVREFARWWKDEAPDFVVACSHGDWIPLFMEGIIGREIELKKSGLAELVWKGPGTAVSLRSLLASGPGA